MDKIFTSWEDSNMVQPRRKQGSRIAMSLALTLALAVSSAQAQSDPFEAYNRGDYATALRELRQAAEQGNAAAQTLLGNMYETGSGVPQSATTYSLYFPPLARYGPSGKRSPMTVRWFCSHSSKVEPMPSQ